MCKCYGLVCMLQAARLFAVPWGRGTAVGGCLLAALVLFSGRGWVCGALPEELHPRQAELVGFLFACVLSRVRFGRDPVVVVFRGKGGARRLALLTSGLRFGHDRVAVVCGGVVLMAPVVQVPLSLRDVVLTGLSEDEADLLLDVWAGE